MRPEHHHQMAAAPVGAHAVLLVDDEPQTRKWFARTYGDEFVVWLAEDAASALALLEQRSAEVAVLMSDHRMPGEDGVTLLTRVCERFPHIVRLLATAYADKDMALAAVNRGHVQQILEKPLDGDQTRAALREALAEGSRRAHERALLDRRAAALRETLGFLAHEVNTPLATVCGYLDAMRERHATAPPDDEAVAHLSQRRPGEVAHLIEAAQRRARYAQSLVTTFLQSARDDWHPDAGVRLRASDLVERLREEYPFEADEMSWLRFDLTADFDLPSRRDLLYLVLCTLVKNAVLALREAPPCAPEVNLTLLRSATAPGKTPQPTIEVSDNGPGIAPELLVRLTREPVTTRAASGGNGMGLLLAHRVMSSLGGQMAPRSTPQQGTSVRLFFPLEDALCDKT